MTQPAGIEGGGMGALTDEAFGAWLDAYGRASAADDPDASAALFATDASYHESPFDAPIVGREAIRRYWAAGALRFTDKRSTYEVIAVRDDIGAARWRSWFTVAGTGQRRALDCIFVARFGDDGTCVEFHEWWHGAAVDDEGARGPPKRTNRTGRADAMLPSFPVADPSLGRHPGRQRPHPTTEDRAPNDERASPHDRLPAHVQRAW